MGPTGESESGVWVTQAGPDDDAIVGDLYLRSWRAGYEGLVESDRLEPVAVERAGYDWRSALSDPTSSFSLGLVGSEPAGIAKVGPDPTESIRCQLLELL